MNKRREWLVNISSKRNTKDALSILRPVHSKAKGLKLSDGPKRWRSDVERKPQWSFRWIDMGACYLYMNRYVRLSSSPSRSCLGVVIGRRRATALSSQSAVMWKANKSHWNPGGDERSHRLQIANFGWPVLWILRIYIRSVGDLFVGVYHTWQQNERIPSVPDRGVVTLLSKDTNNGDVLRIFRSIILLNIEFKILAKVWTKRLGLVADSLVGVAQKRVILNRSIYKNLLYLRCIIEKAEIKASFRVVLNNLDQSKVFNRVEHHYSWFSPDLQGDKNWDKVMKR